MRFFALNNKHNLIILLLMILISCQQKYESDYEKIQNFLTKHSFNKKLDRFNTIVIINDKGTCINCNNDFAQYTSRNLNNKNFLFIISQNGSKVDISPFINLKDSSNVVLDFNQDFYKLKIMNGSGIIKIKNDSLISKTIINSKSIKSFERLNKNLPNYDR